MRVKVQELKSCREKVTRCKLDQCSRKINFTYASAAPSASSVISLRARSSRLPLKISLRARDNRRDAGDLCDCKRAFLQGGSREAETANYLKNGRNNRCFFPRRYVIAASARGMVSAANKTLCQTRVHA